MKVIGQLERAQLEQAQGSASLPGPASAARIFADTTNASAIVPMFFNGTSWVPMSTGTSGGSYSNGSTSGNSTTINWANGLVQTVTLASFTNFTFTNPVAGADHILIIQQAASTRYGFRFTSDVWWGSQKSAIQTLDPNDCGTFRFKYIAGVLPATSGSYQAVNQIGAVPGANNINIDITPDGKLVTVALGSNSPYSQTFQVESKTVQGVMPAVISSPVPVNWVALGKLKQALYQGLPNSPYLRAYSMRDCGPVSAYTAATAASVGAATCIAADPTESLVAVTGGTTPYLQVYLFTPAGWSSPLSNPGTLPAGAGQSCAFSPDSNYVGVAHTSSPFFSVYPVSVGLGFGTKLTNPGTLPSGNGTAIAFSNNGKYIAVGCSSGGVYLYGFNLATGVITYIGNSGSDSPTCLAFSPADDYLYVGDSAGAKVFPITSGALGTAVTITSVNASNNYGCWNVDGTVIYTTQSGTAVVQAIPAYNTVKNWLAARL